MKTIPLALLSDYAKPGKSTAYLVKVVTRELGVFGFASCDKIVVMDDGTGPVQYRPAEELRPSNIQSFADVSVDNTQLVGWFGDAVEEKILAGAFNSAELTVYRVSYLRLSSGYEVIAYGRVGEVSYNSDSKDKRKVEFRSLTQLLTTSTNWQYSLTCRADFGDENCQMPFEWSSGTVSAQGANLFAQFTVSGISQPDGYYDLGVVKFLEGPNAGAELEIESWTAAGVIRLSYSAPYVIDENIDLQLRRDCGKTATDCINYGNIVNMQAEHLTPTEDQSIMVPGAYIKSQNAL